MDYLNHIRRQGLKRTADLVSADWRANGGKYFRRELLRFCLYSAGAAVVFTVIIQVLTGPAHTAGYLYAAFVVGSLLLMVVDNRRRR